MDVEEGVGRVYERRLQLPSRCAFVLLAPEWARACPPLSSANCFPCLWRISTTQPALLRALACGRRLAREGRGSQ